LASSQAYSTFVRPISTSSPVMSSSKRHERPVRRCR
jgi:hypothetical protein